MIYINFVELLSFILHAKFQNHRPSGSGEDFLSFSLFIAMVASLVASFNQTFISPAKLYIKVAQHALQFGFDWPRGFRDL